MDRVVECVPNFSEGRDKESIAAITGAMERCGATLLDVDMGAAANRTVVTIAGPPEAVEEAAFVGIRTAAERIDMTKQSGEHPRMGATDVCPFVPVAGVDMADCVEMARRLGKRVADELGIPVYLYSEAAAVPQRRSLADIRKGEYEGLAEKLKDPAWAPDFGPARFNPGCGATVIGAREFLIAYNVNLNTRDRQKAMRVAVRLREQGGLARSPDGEPLRDPGGTAVRIPGLFRDIRAVGWVIEEYGIAQVSINVLDFHETPLHTLYEEARRLAGQVGVSVTGSEVVGLIPEAALLESGRYYLDRQGLCPGVPRAELIHVASRSLGLSDVQAFDPGEKIIEYRVGDSKASLTTAAVDDFVDSVSMESPVPGGGSVAALCGSLGASLAAMVAGLTVKRRELAPVHPGMKALAVEAQSLKDRLVHLVTEDSASFDGVMAAMRLPRSTEAEKAARDAAVESANTQAALVPLEVVGLCVRVIELATQVAGEGYDSCLSGSGVAASVALAGVEGAALNVLINTGSLKDEKEGTRLKNEALAGVSKARKAARQVLDQVFERLETGK